MAEAVPLPTLLSQLLVAFTIEFDNEFENRMPHWTTDAGRGAGPKGAPWVVSQVMWANVLQYLGAESIRVFELHARSKTKADSLAGLERWSYVVVTEGAAGVPGAAKGARGAQRDDLLVRLTSAGMEAVTIWNPLAAEIEARWVLRFGQETIDGLRRALGAVREQFQAELPHYLPIVSPTQNGMARASLASTPVGASPPASTTAPDPDLSVLLAQVLLQFALDYEADARVSLTIAANTLRVLDETGVSVRELPRLTGVSKEAHGMALGFLVRRQCAVLEPDPSRGRGQRARLTAKGKVSQEKYHRLVTQTEEHWKHRFGEENVTRLREVLLRVTGDQIPLQESVLYGGLTPYPDGWRASVKPAETLPHHPAVLHRGGYPDGS
jgi:DNA-binding MarR family transcriptional regulator